MKVVKLVGLIGSLFAAVDAFERLGLDVCQSLSAALVSSDRQQCRSQSTVWEGECQRSGGQKSVSGVQQQNSGRESEDKVPQELAIFCRLY